jgi:hypothetical protein
MTDDYRLFRPTYSTAESGLRTAATWRIAFRDHQNRRQTLSAGADRRDADRMADRLHRLIQARRDCAALPEDLRKWLDALPTRTRDRLAEMDLIDATAAASDRPLIEHLEGRKDEAGIIVAPGYRQALLARGNTERHARTTAKRVRAVLDGCGFTFWRNLSAPGAAARVEVWLGERRAKGEIGGASFNYYIRDLRGFCRWMQRQGLAPGMALEALNRVENADTDTDRRRALTVEEIRRLVDISADSEMRGRIDRR